MQKRSRAAAILVGVLLLFVVASCFYPALSVGHICRGEDCPVCLQVQLCTRLLKAIALCVFALCCAVLLSGSGRVLLFLYRSYAHPTPVSRKEKLSD